MSLTAEHSGLLGRLDFFDAVLFTFGANLTFFTIWTGSQSMIQVFHYNLQTSQ